MRYFFILGRNPELSLAELQSILPQPCSLEARGGNVVIAECPKLNHEDIMKQLGGTIKIGVLLPHDTHRATQSTILDYFKNQENDKKIFLGLSAYALNEKIQLPTSRQLRQLGIEVKRALQQQGHKVRLVTSQEVALSSVIVNKEKLLRQGAEIVLFYSNKNGPLYIGRTMAVQEFEQASQRDYGRPVRAMGVGMLPIQLAKIMINLARLPKDGILLDPFCGFGTILSEALQMGHKNVIGSDIEQKMIDAARKNLNWQFSVSRETENYRLLCSPVEELSKNLAPNSIDAIVTEPYLGPIRGIRNHELGIMDELKSLYIKAFREFAKILKPGGRVVFIFPAFRQGGKIAKISEKVLPEIKKLGFMPTINPITYSRENQKVLREIFVFVRNF